MLSINSNIQSLVAQNLFAKNNRSMLDVMERLSSGKRITSAKSDPAGFALANRMTSQIRGYEAATKNTNDGISMLQTADSALGSIGDSLQRIRELTVQAANETNSDADRATIKSEIDQIVSDIDQVSKGTQYNGINLLDGSFTDISFQIGANDGDTMEVENMMDARSAILGGQTLVASGTVTGEVVAGSVDNGITAETDLTITTDSGTSGAISYAANASAKDISSAINEKAGSVGVTATASNSATLSDLSSVAGETVSFDLNGETVSAVVDDPTDLSSIAAAINSRSSDTGVVAEFSDSDSNGSLNLTTTDGRDISIESFAGDDAADVGIDFGGETLAENGIDSAVKTGIVTLESTAGQIITDEASAEVFPVADTNLSSFNAISFLDFSDTESISSAIGTVDAAINKVSEGQAEIGSYLNRFDSVVSNLSNNIENTTSARSRIEDADMARESANYAKLQAQQQIGLALMAQANQQSQTVMSLLLDNM